MARIDVQEADVLLAFRERLKSELALPENRCYLTTEPEAPPKIPRGGDYFVSIALGDSQFVTDNQAPEQISEENTVIVTFYTRVQLDTPDAGERVLLLAARGLLPIKRKILKALVGHDLALPTGETFLRQLLFATHAARPRYDAQEAIAYQSISFAVDYDVDLESAE